MRPLDTTAITAPPRSRFDYGFDLGGYIVKDKLWFFAAYNRVERTDETEVVRRSSPPPGSPFPGAPMVDAVIPLDRETTSTPAS